MDMKFGKMSYVANSIFKKILFLIIVQGFWWAIIIYPNKRFELLLAAFYFLISELPDELRKK